MEVYVGCSGFMYSWNPDGLEWYLTETGLNSLELNTSFYRFPFPNQVKSWKRKTEQLSPSLRWSIKVNRLITHVFKFNERAFETWKKFEKLFEPLKENIDFYLFQLPPSLTSKFFPKLENFIRKTNLKEKFALEVRNISWFEEKYVKEASKLGITWVSVDSPDFPREVYCSNKIVYLRMHGRTAWYSHFYTNEELEEIKEKILKIKPEKVYIFFNNNHAMLSNAISMLKLLTKGKFSRKENKLLKLKKHLFVF